MGYKNYFTGRSKDTPAIFPAELSVRRVQWNTYARGISKKNIIVLLKSKTEKPFGQNNTYKGNLFIWLL